MTGNMIPRKTRYYWFKIMPWILLQKHLKKYFSPLLTYTITIQSKTKTNKHTRLSIRCKIKIYIICSYEQWIKNISWSCFKIKVIIFQGSTITPVTINFKLSNWMLNYVNHRYRDLRPSLRTVESTYSTRTARGHDKKALTRSHQLGTFRLFMRYAVTGVGYVHRGDITTFKYKYK